MRTREMVIEKAVPMCSDSRYILKRELRGRADTLCVVCDERRSWMKLHLGS